MLGLYFADEGQHIEHRLFVDHDQPRTSSHVVYKGALQGEGAHTVWIGNVLIRKVAEGIETYEENRNLVLTDGCQADSVPNLEIETGEIEGAGHASTVGRFDDEQLFYLRSRGIAGARGPAPRRARLLQRPDPQDRASRRSRSSCTRDRRGRAREERPQGPCPEAPHELRARLRPDEVPDDEALGVTVGVLDVAVARDGDEVFAIQDLCSHAAVALSEGEVADCTIECWLHGSRFDLRTGKPTGLPATEPVATFPVEVRESPDGTDDVYVDTDHHPERSDPRMSTLEIKDLHVSVADRGRPQGDPQGRHADHRRRRDPRDHGPQRLRQVDPGLLDRGPPEVHRHRRHRDPRRRGRAGHVRRRARPRRPLPRDAVPRRGPRRLGRELPAHREDRDRRRGAQAAHLGQGRQRRAASS